MPRFTVPVPASDSVHDRQEDDGPLSGLLTFRLLRLAETISRSSTRAYRSRFGINNTELRVLVMLAGGEASTIAQLSRRMHIDKGWVSRSVDAMMGRGLLCKRPHATDSRAGLVSLTREGRVLVASLSPLARARHDMLVEGLDTAALETLLAELERRVEGLLSLS